MTNFKNEGKRGILNESKNTFIECIPETELFQIKYMLYPNKDREHLQNLNELVSLESQAKAARLEYKLGEQNFQ